MFSNLKSNFSKFKLAVLSMLMMFIINIIPASFVQASVFINENLLPNQYSEENESTNSKQGISSKESEQVDTSFNEVANYIKRNKNLPSNFITKDKARSLGWIASKGNLAEIAPGKSIGGDFFIDRDNKLPYKSGRIWREADIDYVSGFRNNKRLIYSNDGLFFKTVDHYNDYTKMNI